MIEPDSSSSSVVSSTSPSEINSCSDHNNPSAAATTTTGAGRKISNTSQHSNGSNSSSNVFGGSSKAPLLGTIGKQKNSVSFNDDDEMDEMIIEPEELQKHKQQHWLNSSGNKSTSTTKITMTGCSSSSSTTTTTTMEKVNMNNNNHHHEPCSSSSSSAAQLLQSSNLSSTQNNLSPTKNKPPKLCQVCGDKAKSFHFGGLSCDSCKAFFRRSVHNDAHKGFQCIYQHCCEINISSRKSCQFCRFKKCMAIGMEMNWVMTEEERNALQKQRNEKKNSTSSATSVKSPLNSTASQDENSRAAAAENNFEPNVADMLKYMSVEERDEIESIVNKYQHSYREIPFRVGTSSGSRNSVEIIQMFTTILRRFAYFTKLIPEFSGLAVNDQSTLLRAGVLEMCLLRSALAFDTKNNRWPKTENMEFLKDCPQLRVEDMEKLVSKDLYHMHMQFINGIQELKVDEPTIMILLLIVLFYPERGPLEQQEVISKIQEKYLLLLNKYVQWRYGAKSTKIFPKLLTRLADLRQLNDFHTEYNLKMTKTEVEEIQEQLGNINLNPYPQWVLVEDQQVAGGEGGGGGAASAAAQYHQHIAHAYAEGGSPVAYDSAMMMQGQGPELGFQQQQQHQIPYQGQGGQHEQQYYSPPPSHQMPTGGGPGMPPQAAPAAGHAPTSMRQLFMQFVNQKIPALIANPFVPFSMENEMAAAFFEQMSGGGGGGMAGATPGGDGAPGGNPLQHFQAMLGGRTPGGGGDPTFAQQAPLDGSDGGMDPYQQHQQGIEQHMSPPLLQEQQQQQQLPTQMSQISNILESSDPNALRQLKESLSPSVIAKLSSVFGGAAAGGEGGANFGGLLSGGAGGGNAGPAGGGGFDLSKIPQPLISAFMARASGGRMGGAPGGGFDLSKIPPQLISSFMARTSGGGVVPQATPPVQQQPVYHQHQEQPTMDTTNNYSNNGSYAGVGVGQSSQEHLAGYHEQRGPAGNWDQRQQQHHHHQHQHQVESSFQSYSADPMMDDSAQLDYMQTPHQMQQHSTGGGLQFEPAGIPMNEQQIGNQAHGHSMYGSAPSTTVTTTTSTTRNNNWDLD